MVKRKAEIRIHNLNSVENPFGVDFNGYQEGSGSPCSNEVEVQEEVKSLLSRWSQEYSIEIFDDRKKEIQKCL